MSNPKFVLVAHMGHDAIWLQIKTIAEVRNRLADIETNKPERERPLRLKLLKIVREPLPPELAEAYATRVEAGAVLAEADAARMKGPLPPKLTEAHAAWVEDAALAKAHAAWVEAHAAWVRAVVSREGVAFHKKVCGCAWTPEQPNILLQLADQQEKEDE